MASTDPTTKVGAIRAALKARLMTTGIDVLEWPADAQALPLTADFDAWAARQQTIVWPEFVRPDLTARATRACPDRRRVLVPMWEQLRPADLPALANYTAVVCPSRACHTLLRKHVPTAPLRYIPYDVGQPRLARKRPDDGAVVFYYPAAGPQPRRQAAIVLPLFDALLAEFPRLRVRISYLRDWPYETRAALASLRERWEPTGRLTVVRNGLHVEHLQACADSDLVVWLTGCEGIGLLGPEALSQGTPVAALDVPPVSEYLAGGGAVLLPPAALTYNELGVPTAQPDRDLLAATLRRLAAGGCELADLRAAAQARSSAALAAECLAGWQEVFRGA